MMENLVKLMTRYRVLKNISFRNLEADFSKIYNRQSSPIRRCNTVCFITEAISNTNILRQLEALDLTGDHNTIRKFIL